MKVTCHLYSLNHYYNNDLDKIVLQNISKVDIALDIYDVDGHRFPSIVYYINDNNYFQVIWNLQQHRLSVNYFDGTKWTEVDYINTNK